MTHTNVAFEHAKQRIIAGDVDAVRSALDAHPQLATARTEPPASATLLHYTAFNAFPECDHPAPASMPEIAHLLIERGSDADATSHGQPHGTPLCWALSSWLTHCSGVQIPLAETYLAGGAKIEGVANDGAPLGHAIGFSYTKAAEFLASRGARANTTIAAAALGRVDQLAAWWNGTSFDAEAEDFVRTPQPERGRFSWPPAGNARGLPIVLVTAATHGRLQVVEWALSAGADPNEAVGLNQTALHFAAYVGHANVVDCLLAAGARADIRERQFDRTAAEWAAETDESEIAERLREDR